MSPNYADDDCGYRGGFRLGSPVAMASLCVVHANWLRAHAMQSISAHDTYSKRWTVQCFTNKMALVLGWLTTGRLAQLQLLLPVCGLLLPGCGLLLHTCYIYRHNIPKAVFYTGIDLCKRNLFNQISYPVNV